MKIYFKGGRWRMQERDGIHPRARPRDRGPPISRVRMMVEKADPALEEETAWRELIGDANARHVANKGT
jgi:hypothetical protein